MNPLPLINNTQKNTESELETPHATVAILDCGAQYTKVIDRRVRQLNIESTIFPLNTSSKALQNYQAIIISGGPRSVHDHSALEYDPELFNLNKPILGICYGMQLIANHFGGTVEQGQYQEYGQTEIIVDTESTLFSTLEKQQQVLMSHGDHVSQLPPNFKTIATSKEGLVAAITHTQQPVVGLQFHPEVELSINGNQMLKNFLLNIAHCQPSFTIENRLENTLKLIQQQAGTRPVLSLVSGGVDSAVTTALLLKALPNEQVFALHMDTGMMRLNESDSVIEGLKHLGLKNLTYLKAETDFLEASTTLENGTVIGPLKATTQPEHKRRIIGDTFLKLTQQAILDLGLDLENTLIAQGTLRPDLIESGNPDVSQSASVIKTHHNDVPLIQAQRKKGLIIETNRDLHKDEVREIGRLCGLPAELVERQPFPGPGLGIRILCATEPHWPEETTPEQFEADVSDFLKTPNITPKLLPIQSVGVQGDARSYRHPLALFGITPANLDNTQAWSQELPNRFKAINRVIVALNQPELITPQFIPTHLNHDTLELLRQADAFVLKQLAESGYLKQFAQTFCVLLPLGFTNARNYSIVIRSVLTSDFMTARTAKLKGELPLSCLQKIAEKFIVQFPVSAVFYDVTPKPPATVEWE